MSQKLIESILDKNFVVAESHFRDRLNTIKEQKLFEMKKMMQAEVFGGLSPAEIEMRKKAGYRKAADVLGDPSKQKMPAIKGHKFKKIKKKVAEGVEVQPDPEGRVRGGKPAKGTVARNVAAKAIRIVRKGSKVAGDVGAEIVGRVSAAKKSWQQYKKQKAKATSSDADWEKSANAVSGSAPSHPKSTSEVKPKQSWLRRNTNTALGRDPDYDPKAPENQSRGGRAGKALRSTVKGVGTGISALGSYGSLAE